LQALGKFIQHLVANIMAQGIVDALEIIQINEQQPQCAPCLGLGIDRLFQQLAEHEPIRQTGQGVLVGDPSNLPIMLLQRLGHGIKGPDQHPELVAAPALQLDFMVATLGQSMGRVGQRPNRSHQTAGHHNRNHRPDGQQQCKRDHQTPHLGDEALPQLFGKQGLFAHHQRIGRGSRQADPDAPDTDTAEQNRPTEVKQLIAPLRDQAFGSDHRSRQRIGHHFTETLRRGAAVVHQPAIVFIDHDVAHIRPLQHRDDGLTQTLQVVVIEQVGQRLSERFKAQYPSLAQRLQGVLTQCFAALLDQHIVGANTGVPQPCQHPEHRHGDQRQGQGELASQGQYRSPHCSSRRTRSTSGRSVSICDSMAGVIGLKRCVPK